MNKNLLSKYYENNPYFAIVSNSLCWLKTETDIIPLLSGVIAITKEITELNGIEETIMFEVSATDKQGNRLKTIMVNSNEFMSLNWIVKYYGCKIPFSPNNATKQKIINALLLSGNNAEKKTVYKHTGYLTEDNKPVNYLYFGGNVCMDPNIETDINPILTNYVLTDSNNKKELKEITDKVLSIINLNEYSVMFPLLAFAFMPVLKPVITSVIGNQSFGIYLKGKTQSGKSTLASIITSFYGCFDTCSPTCSFNATANGIQELSFLLKDSINWIDDFIPRYDKQEQKKQNLTMQNISRYIGDNASRLKLNSDSTIRTSHNARCFFIMTGEDDIQIGQSGIARIFTIPLIRHNCNIIEFSELARNGKFTPLTALFIKYVIDNFPVMQITFENIYKETLQETVKQFEENRLSKQTALLIACLYCFLYFLKSNKLIETGKGRELLEAGKKAIIQASIISGNDIFAMDPENKYKTAISELLNKGRKYLIDLFDSNRHDFSLGMNDNVIGYYDSDFIYLDSNLAYKSVCEYWELEHEYFSISKNQIQKQLLKSGYFISGTDNPCIVKNIKGKSLRLLKINKQGII